MRKVLQINTVINTGSTGRIAEQIGLAAIRQGWDSYIAYGRYGNDSQSEVIKIGSKWDNYRHVIRTRLTDGHGLGSIAATRQFIQRIKEIKPDIIHLHNIHGYYLNYQILFEFLKECNTPTVWTLHDCWPITGHGIYKRSADYSKKNGCYYGTFEMRGYPKSYYNNSHSNYLKKKAAFNSLGRLVLVPVSKWLENKIKESFLKDLPTHLIYNGIPLDQFRPKMDPQIREKYKIVGKTIYLGIAGKWEERKGLEEFIRFSRVIDPNEIIVLVGPSKKQIKNLPSNIIGIERTEDLEELVDLYNTADFFLNLTMADSFSMVNIESLACGTPVITYASGGCPETIDESTGMVIPSGDIHALKGAVEQLKKWDQIVLKKRCRERAERLFDSNKQFDKYLTLYEKVIDHR